MLWGLHEKRQHVNKNLYHLNGISLILAEENPQRVLTNAFF